MKSLSDMLEKSTLTNINPFHTGQIITAVWAGEDFLPCKPTANEDVSCPVCKGTEGSKVLNPPTKEVWWSCVRVECISPKYEPPGLKIAPLKTRLDQAGVPTLLCDATFEDWYHQEEMKKDLKTWSNNPKGSCILSGPRGVGKTYMAAASMGHFTRKGDKGAFFIDIAETKYRWLEEMRGDRPKTLSHKMIDTDLLVIDDIDKVNPSDAFYEFIYLVINSRYGAMKPTIVTMTIGFNELESRIGDSLTSRLYAKEGLFLEVSGEDLRQ